MEVFLYFIILYTFFADTGVTLHIFLHS